MSGTQKLLVRLLLSGSVGLCVAFVPLWLVVGGADSRDIWFRRQATRTQFKRVDQLLADYRRQHGRYPATLKVFGYSALDGWGQPFLYSVRDGWPSVESLGKDGVRGGIGMNADLSSINPKPAASQVPFLKRVSDSDALPMSFAALGCGVVAAWMTLAGLQSQTFELRTWPLLGLSLLLSAGMAVVGAILITVGHTPSGH